MSIDPNSWLLAGGVAAAKFDTVGRTIAGRITEPPEVRQQTDFETGQLKTWDNGDPMMQLVITVATDERAPGDPDDDGVRRLYVKGKMQQAVANAVRTAKSKLEVGGILSVSYTGDDEPKRRGMSGAKLYTASYTPAAESFLEQPEPVAVVPTQATAPPAAIQAAPTAGNGDVSALQAAMANLTREQKVQLGLPV